MSDHGELEKASIAFFKAVHEAGAEIIGHTAFAFKIDCTFGTKPEDIGRAKVLGARVQEALDTAKNTIIPSEIKTSLR